MFDSPATPWTVAHQVPLSMEFSRQEYWSGLPFPSPEDLPNPGIEPMLLMSPALAGRFFTTNAIWEALYIFIYTGRSPGERNGYTLQYSCLENSMDIGAWRATVHELGEQIKMLELCFCLVIGDGM